MLLKQMLVLAGAAFLGFLLGFTKVASAHSVQTSNYTYHSNDHNCTWGESRLDHGGGGGYVRTGVLSKIAVYAPNWTVPCGDYMSRPPSNLSVRATLFKWDGSNWNACWQSAWMFNSATSANYAADRDFGSSPPCQNGWYNHYGESRVHFNGQWWGGGLWSGNHSFP
jgi:hypothetical protein